jgi:hypothetical protein
MDAVGACFVLLLVSALDVCDVGWHCHIGSRHEYVNETYKLFTA